MPDAIITATESTFGTISGTFSADQSTVTGTVTGVITGTLDGSVGVPGPAGPGVPAGGTAGQILQKIDGTNYNTDWVTVNFSATWGNITGTLSSQTDLQTELDLKAPLAGATFTGVVGFNGASGNVAAKSTGYFKAYTSGLESTDYSLQYDTGLQVVVGGTTVARIASSGILAPSAGITFSDATTQTSAGITAATAASTYYLQTNPAGYITSAALSGYATESFVTYQGYITSSALTPYLTTATAASTYFTIASAANKADIASPTFTGTPSLPTGTTAVTQTAGNNTTAVATTAFVTAAVPAFATFTTPEVNSTNTIVSPRVAMDYIMHPGRTEWLKFGSGATSGTGAVVVTPVSTRSVEVVGPNAGVAGYAMAVWDTSFSGVGMLGMTRGANMLARAWNKPVWASCRGQIGYYGNNVYNGDAHSTIRVSVGGKSSVGSGPISITDPGFGWLIPGVGSALQLQVSRGNSSALTTVTSSFTPVAKQIFDWKMYSDGAGNVTLWINDDVVATTANGPTTSTPESYNFYFEMVEQTASTATRVVWESLNSRLWWGV